MSSINHDDHCDDHWGESKFGGWQLVALLFAVSSCHQDYVLNVV